MELWIRSQDKEALIKADKIFYWNTCPEMPNTGKHYLGNKEWVGNADYTKLGEYNTKERALEILNEIQKLITPQIIMKEMKTTGLIENGMSDGTLYIKNEPHIEMVSPVIYEMPKE